VSRRQRDDRPRGRRGHGEGSVYWREDRQRWVVELDLGNVDGRRKRPVRTFKSEKEAIRYLAQARQKLATGEPLADARIRFAHFLDHWLDQVVEPSKRKPATKASYRDNIALHVKPGLGHLRLADLRHEHVLAFLNGKRDKGYSASTMRTLLVIIRQVLDHAVVLERVGRNVADKVNVPEPLHPARAVHAWTLADGRRLLVAARETRLYALYVLLAMVGLRRGEVLALSWRDVDLDAGVLRVERQVQRIRGLPELVVGPPKSKSSRREVSLPPYCVTVLREHYARQQDERQAAGQEWRDLGLVFPTARGTYMEPRNLNRHLSALCQRAGLDPTGLHVLRHTAATMAYALGVNWRQIQDMLGHSLLGTTMNLYVDEVPRLQREAAHRIDEGFGRSGEMGDGSPADKPQPR
jgi:integrase